ncbi:MAG: prolyl oligopeptidase family serine peptidase [Oscillospiraceae bacterium]|nr:prolyl oligopeptidase family serine peptidase [Oscillospiraceae bacterium]
MIKRLLKAFAVILAVLLTCTPHFAFSEDQGTLENITRVSEGHYTCTYDGIRHAFIVDLPEKAEGSPLILMLHGYGGTAESFRTETGFEKDANPLGYTVVYVTGAPNPDDKTSSNSWNSGIGSSPNRDVGLLTALAKYLQQEYRLDKQHTAAVGYSNGAFMAHRLALEANSTFSAVVSVAGTVPASIWNERDGQVSAGLLQVTGEKDDVIPKHSDGSARYAKEPAIEDVIEYYVTVNGLEIQEILTAGKKSVLTKYGSPASDMEVWHLLVKDGRHSWSGERVTGINTNRLILEYLETQIR